MPYPLGMLWKGLAGKISDANKSLILALTHSQSMEETEDDQTHKGLRAQCWVGKEWDSP